MRRSDLKAKSFRIIDMCNHYPDNYNEHKNEMTNFGVEMRESKRKEKVPQKDGVAIKNSLSPKSVK